MKHKLIVKDFTDRFAIQKVGIGGYEDEKELWNLPEGCEPTFCHIIVRVADEYRKAKENKELNTDTYPFDQYLFLINRGAKTVFENFFGDGEPINIYFIPVKSEIEDWCYGFPDPDDINWDYDGKVSKIVKIKNNEYLIPKSMRLGSPLVRDQVLLIKEFKYIEECGSVILDCSGSHCRKIGSSTSIEKFLRGRESFGVFENSEEIEECKPYQRCVVACAKLKHPYMGYTKITENLRK